MSPKQQLIKNFNEADGVVPGLMMHEGAKLMAEKTEQAFEEIEVRATQVGSVLEGILHEAHGNARWGLNE